MLDEWWWEGQRAQHGQIIPLPPSLLPSPLTLPSPPPPCPPGLGSPMRGEEGATMACTRRRSMTTVSRSLEACFSARGTRPGVLRMKRTEEALPAAAGEVGEGGSSRLSSASGGGGAPRRSADTASASPECLGTGYESARCWRLPERQCLPGVEWEFSPANHRMSSTSSTSSGETACRVVPLRSMAARKALGSMRRPA